MDATVHHLPSACPDPDAMQQVRDALLDARAFFARRDSDDDLAMFDKLDRALAALPKRAA